MGEKGEFEAPPSPARRKWLIPLLILGCIVLILVIVIPIVVTQQGHGDNKYVVGEAEARALALKVLKEVPLVDGHNDLPWQMRAYFYNKIEYANASLNLPLEFLHTNIKRLREGHVGAQFWADYVPCASQFKDSIRFALQQADLIKRITHKYNDTFEMAYTADDIERIFKSGKIASLIGLESGHAIESSLAILRMMYDIGVRYMTLTHSCNTPWADSTTPEIKDHNGLTEFGKTVVREMNRLGMLVDLSHVSFDTMRQALEVTTAPVIYSHSSAYALRDHERNVPDDILKLTAENGGVVMVNFYNLYINKTRDYASIEQVADHIMHIRKVAGVDYVGIGSDYDGVCCVPKGLEDVSKFPDLITLLARMGLTEVELKKIVGDNVLRVMRGAEKVKSDMANQKPFDTWINPTPNASGCASNIYNTPLMTVAQSEALAEKVLTSTPLVDGHNDLPWQMRASYFNKIEYANASLNLPQASLHTSIGRLRKGRVGAQFWADYVPCASQYKDSIRYALQQADLIKRITYKYNNTFEMAYTAADIERVFKSGKIASLIGLESGHAIESSLAVLRMMYDLGVRYMTLTHSCNTPWADSATPALKPHNGLTDFGRTIIREMNRLGMLIDLSHVSVETMKDTLAITKAPVIYSHSSAFTLCKHERNVPDDVLNLVARNRGVVMVNFYSLYISCSNQNATLEHVADHIMYIKRVAGINAVGLGSDYDGVCCVPKGLEDVSKFPDLIATLARRGLSESELKKVVGDNLLRVLKETERVRDELKNEKPFDVWLTPPANSTGCLSPNVS